ncbi:MAG: host attachment protein [bacterium]|nr:host attachment protein [bacterium]
MNNSVWVVAANGAKARIFTNEDGNKLKEIETFEHPASRLHDQDLVSDKPGQEFGSFSHRRSAIEPSIDPHKNELIHFAQELSKHIEHALNTNVFKKLYLIASPIFLGILRKSLHEQVQKAVVLSIDKDLVGKSAAEIREYLPFTL